MKLFAITTILSVLGFTSAFSCTYTPELTTVVACSSGSVSCNLKVSNSCSSQSIHFVATCGPTGKQCSSDGSWCFNATPDESDSGSLPITIYENGTSQKGTAKLSRQSGFTCTSSSQPSSSTYYKGSWTWSW